MATTVIPNQPRRRAPQPRVSVRVRDTENGHDHEYDLLTAALIGATVGAGLTFLLRRGPSGNRPLMPMLHGVGRGASWTGRRGARLAAAGARWAADRGEGLWERIPRDEIREHVSDYMKRAREAIDDVVDSELTDLRRAVRRQRKRLGI